MINYVPMDTNVVFDMVDNLDKDPVTFPSIYGGTGILSVDGDNGLA